MINSYLVVVAQSFIETNMFNNRKNIMYFLVKGRTENEVFEKVKKDLDGISGDLGETYIAGIIDIQRLSIESNKLNKDSLPEFLGSWWIPELGLEKQFKLSSGLISEEVK